MDKLRRVARAIADDDPRLRVVANAALEEINQEIATLRHEQEAILKMVQVVKVAHGVRQDDPLPVAQTVPAEPVVDLDAEAKFTDIERQIMNTVVEQALAVDSNPTVDSLIAAIEDRGIPIRKRVSRPPSVVGTILFFAKKRMGIAPPNGAAVAPRGG